MTASIPNRVHRSGIALLQLVAGLVLVGLAWPTAWAGHGELRAHTFFPLWLGYILIVDASTRLHSGTSLLARLGRFAFVPFLLSIPIWWLFEAINARLNNWVYIVPHPYSWWRYHLEATLAFSTVLPAVFVTAELVASLTPDQINLRKVDPSPRTHVLIGLGGAVMIAATLIAPDVFFPLVWIGFFFVADWLASLWDAPHLSAPIRAGNWRPVLNLFAATLLCGFFWEMWNSRSLPKWTYVLPWGEWGHLFEMPLPGYGGYLPFGLELYALSSLLDRASGSHLMRALRFDKEYAKCT